MANIIQAYKDAALFPTPVSAVLYNISKKPERLNIYTTWTIPDVIRAESTKFSKEHLLSYESNNFQLLNISVPVDTSSVSKQVFSKSGRKYAVFRKSNKSDDAVFLEIWNMSGKESTFDLTDSKEHGAIQYESFAAFEWSTDENYLLYIANVHQEKNESYFKDSFCKKSSSADEKPKGEEFLYKESWGECNATAHHTVLCIFDVKTGNIEVLNLDDKFPNTSIGQATWGPNDEYIVFVGYEETPYRLGIVYCPNRRSAIFSYNVKCKSVDRLILEENMFYKSPIFSPDYKTFVFLQNKANGPHARTKKLMKFDWQSKELKTVVDVVNEEYCAAVYSEKLSRCFSSDSRFFFFNSLDRSYMRIYYADMRKNEVGVLESPNDKCSVVLLDVKDQYIVAYVSSPNQPPILVVGWFLKISYKFNIVWHTITNEMNKNLHDLTWVVDTIQPSLKNETYPDLSYEIVTVWSTEKRNDALLLYPHGGPHSAFSLSYYPAIAAFAKLGFAVCLVNYRGSIGFGENSIMSLPGNVGTQDIVDMVDTVVFLKKNKKELNIKQVFATSGSHGGFIIAHLLGQYPDLLTAAAIRNPVIDLPSIFAVSDIPDWCCIEGGFPEPYDPSTVLDPTSLEKLWQKSPIRYVKNVKSPTLILLGKCDLRVPPSQGLLFYRYLRAQNVPTKVYLYDDNHALSKVGVSSDAFVHIATWLMKYLTD